MNHLYHSGFLEALGWSLIDSLWQMGIVWVSYVLITGNGKKSNASYRYSVALLAIVSGCLWFAASIAINYYHLNDGHRVFGLVYLLQHALPAIDEQKWMPLVSSLYLLIVLVYASGWIFALAGNQKRFGQRLPLPGTYYDTFVHKVKNVAGISRNVRLWVSEEITSPITFGFLKPVILLPLAALSQFSVKQVEAMIVHELYHIRRNDYIANILMTLGQILLFFNPFARLLIDSAMKEREHCCDDEVINLGYDRWEYAQALYLLGKNSIEKYPFALAATGTGKQLLLQRVKRMLNRGYSSPPLVKPVSIFFLCLVLAGSISRDLDKPLVQQQQIMRVEQSATFVTHKKAILRQATEDVKATQISAKPLPPPPPPAPIALPESEHRDYEKMIVASYVLSEARTIEFTMIEAQISEAGVRENSEACDVSHPYIPGSTFYFPGHEISIVENGKTTIDL